MVNQLVDGLTSEGFKCEICGEWTPMGCEGTEPNTCAMCMPYRVEEQNSFE